MVTEEGQAKIMDFGLARITGQTMQTKEGMVIGTIAYMSPEQAKGEEVDHRTDIWSLGVVLYEILSGQLPFKGEQEQAVVFAILNKKPKPITDLHLEIPTSLEQVVSKVLEKDPDKRYQQAEELLDDLKSISAGIVPEEIKARLRKEKLRKRKRAILYAGAAAVIITLTFLGLILLKGPPETIDSIAVLPLENLTGDKEKEFFVDVATEELIGKLGQISGLRRVISRTSVMKFKETDKTLSEIARELNVDAVVEGSVQQTGDRVRIQVRLIDALPEEKNLWGQTYERAMSDVLVMYSEMARAIAEKAQVNLTDDELMRLTSANQINPESYDAYLKGLFHHEKYTPEGLKIALQYYNLAIELDPNNALAYVGVSGVWGIRYQTGMVPREDALPLITTPIEKALELDNTLADAHSALAAHRCWREWDWEGAEKEWQQVLRLNPNHAGAHQGYSLLLCIMGRAEEALPHIELAFELDPLDFLLNHFYGLVLNYHRRYDDALAAFRTVLDIEPNFMPGIGMMIVTLSANEMYDEVLAIWRKMGADNAELNKALEDGLEVAGYNGAARAVADFMAEGYGKPGINVDIFAIANTYNVAGEYDLAIDWFIKCYEEQNPNLAYIGSPLYDSLRSYPRFQDLLRKMNLPVDEQE
jgi:TolB-like protein